MVVLLLMFYSRQPNIAQFYSVVQRSTKSCKFHYYLNAKVFLIFQFYYFFPNQIDDAQIDRKTIYFAVSIMPS